MKHNLYKKNYFQMKNIFSKKILHAKQTIENLFYLL
jgi:hypothetical protein